MYIEIMLYVKREIIHVIYKQYVLYTDDTHTITYNGQQILNSHLYTGINMHT